ncbi:conjugal transfer protein TrbL family protein [Catellatospora chokoriensis]|uniref:Uncharacterized protein n=1 Tax=Catellatospora chokoriensis TaxID=310353 RepID=A0A8J3K4C1_9ACTN|nr:conjugal transfer protein TrbL family protein [Catellatospora chokoriensis]GIF90465.1 hypothetical protein Cch02nite_39090 [Catellatospora chokoriensis]
MAPLARPGVVSELPFVGLPVEAMVTALNTFLAKVLLGLLGSLLDLLRASVFTSPDVTVLPQVASTSWTAMAVVDTCYVLVIVAAAASGMTDGLVQVRYTLADLGPRLVVAFVGANFALPLCSGLIQTANALTMALTADTIWSQASLLQLRSLIEAAQTNMTGTVAFLFTVVLVLIAVLAAMLVCQWLARVGVLIVLCAIAPVALACHGLPATDAAARAWWRSMLAALGTQLLQAVCLHVCISVLVSDQAPVLPAASDTQLAVLRLFTVLVLLWGTARIPSLMGRFATNAGGGGQRLGSYLVKSVLINRGLGALRTAGGGGRRPMQVVNVRNITYNRLSQAALPSRPTPRPGSPGPAGSGGATPPAGSRPNGPRPRPRSGPGPAGPVSRP